MRRLCGMIVITVLMSALPVFSQSDEDAEAFVLDALEQLNETSYHFVMENSQSTELTPEEGDPETTAITYMLEGDYAANGDQQVTIEAQTASGDEAVTFMFERIVVGDTVYLNIPESEFLQTGNDAPEPGWTEIDITGEMPDTGIEVAFRNIATLTTPADLIPVEHIESVTELALVSIDGVDMRLFEIQVDEQAAAFDQMLGTLEERLEAWAREREVYAAGEVAHRYRVWIGADNGQVYRGEADGLTVLPYLSADIESGPRWDYRSEIRITFEISNIGIDVEIEAPI